MTTAIINFDDLQTIDVSEIKKDFLSAHYENNIEIFDAAKRLGLDVVTFTGSKITKFVLLGEVLMTIGVEKNLTKEDVIFLLNDSDCLELVANKNCEPTNRVGYNGVCQGDQLTEWSATVEINEETSITAYYYTTNDEDQMAAECGDLSCINWEISHYTVQ